MSHLVEYIAYLKREIFQLRAQLADALAERKLYEPLLKRHERPLTPPPIPPPPKGYFDWLRFK
jgi:hypothetical protein